MKILHLEASSGWGGQEMRILREAEGMRNRGHELFFVVMRGAVLGIQARQVGFVVYEVNFHKGGWFGCLAQLLRIIRRHQIELLNTHSSLDSWIGGIAGRLARRKVIRTRHLSTPIKKGWNSRLLYGALADFVVTTCQAMVEPIGRQSGKAPEKVRSIATGVDPSRIVVSTEEAAQFKAAHQIGPKDFLVGTACFMRSWKGIESFLEAAALLKNESKIKWLLIGGGHIEKYRRLAQEMNLSSNVIFTGHLNNPFPALRALDLFALLSTAHEGVSQAILQAAYLERPLIATPIGGLSEVCLEGVTGMVVPPFAPEEVARRVLFLQSNPDLRKKLGQQAKTYVLKNFTFQRTLDEMEQIYYSLSGH